MVGAVGDIQAPELRNERQVEAAHPLLALWNSAQTQQHSSKIHEEVTKKAKS